MTRLSPVMLLLAFVACAPPADEAVDLWEELPAEELAPPIAPATLTTTPLVSGVPFTVTITGQAPGTVMNILWGTNTTGPGVCPPAITPTCLAVANPFQTLATVTTNAAGVATLNLPAPPAVPPRVELQAYGARSGIYYLSNGLIVNGFVGTADADADGLPNAQEVARGTGITNPDSDSDGLRDGPEVSGGSNPLDADSDDDGLNDGAEVAAGTGPLDPDSDDDTLSDGQEVSAGTDPLSSDTDGDGLLDAAEVGGGTNPSDPDTDGDGVEDGDELTGGTDPLDADSDDDNVGDGDELLAGTDPLLFDTDGDGLGDDEGTTYGTDPLNPDSDGGGVGDGDEISNGTDPLDGLDDASGVCGDGTIQSGEDCDDANTNNGDDCPNSCLWVREVEPNDSPATASGPFLGPVLVHGDFNPAGDYDWYQFTVPAYADVRIETSDVAGTCAALDTLIDVYRATDTTVAIATDDDDSVGTCSLLQSGADVGVRHMAPGTYYLRIHEYQDNDTFTDLRTRITFDALCGDGVRAGSEQCDGGATCGTDCMRIPTCGDGFTDNPETCDDGNTDSGDGCSASCALEGVASEIEPNDSTAAADTTGLLITGPVVVSAAANPIADKDFFKIGQFPNMTVATFETFENAAATDCTTSTFTTMLNLLNAAGTNVTTDSTIPTAGIRSCSAVSFPLDAATTYYIEAEENGRNATLPAYYLRAEFPPGIGTEVEPNENLATATPLTGAMGWISGGHQVTADLDWYSISVPQGASLRLEIIEGSRAVETCESNGIDAKITLFNGTGGLLGADDDDGRGFCSLVDGTGSVSQSDTWAHNLAAGTYYIQVNSAVSTGLASQFDYKLIWKVRAP